MSFLLLCRLLVVTLLAFTIRPSTSHQSNPNNSNNNPNNYYAEHDRHLHDLCYVCSDANKEVSNPTSKVYVDIDGFTSGLSETTCGEWQSLGLSGQLDGITCFNVQMALANRFSPCDCATKGSSSWEDPWFPPEQDQATAVPLTESPTRRPTNKPTTPPPTKSPTSHPTRFPTSTPSLSKAPSGAPTASPTRCFSPFFVVSYYGEPLQRLTCDEDTIIYNNVAGQNVTVALSLDDPSLVADSASVQLALDGVTTSVEGVVADDPYKFYGLFGERNDGNGFFKDWTNFAQNQTYAVTASLWNNAGAVVAEFDIIIHIM